VLHRPQGGGPGRYPDLVVEVLDVLVGVFGAGGTVWPAALSTALVVLCVDRM